jgi:hypothetical protein
MDKNVIDGSFNKDGCSFLRGHFNLLPPLPVRPLAVNFAVAHQAFFMFSYC